LAGGKSSRMSSDKSLLPYKNFDSLAEFQYDRLSQIFSSVYISTKREKFNFKANYIIDDNIDVSSPMVALYSVLKYLKSRVFIIAVDTPLVSKYTILDIINASDNYDITLARSNNKIHNLCGVFDINIESLVKKMLKNDNHKMKDLLQNSSVNSKIMEFLNDEEFLNVNTIDDYKLLTKSYLDS
jgi:molybdopterin-guanine dinucleotide biosynthesis protein A